MKFKLGSVNDYYIRVGVMALKLEKKIALGDTIQVKGEKTNIVQKVDSIIIEHLPVRSARPGDIVGIKTDVSVQPGDVVYKLAT
ncbi:MAG: hypothetical protein A2219_00905 [Elusimicrobia bacterium RIFOXYA2_FULL_50_26]|nr:MAG: hypothetical protein A2219_00905 [Elusimicrobia bacterium RIFOXYA2_FULL_50_26]